MRWIRLGSRILRSPIVLFKIDGLVHGYHDAERNELANNLGRLNVHLLSKVSDDDGFLHLHNPASTL